MSFGIFAARTPTPQEKGVILPLFENLKDFKIIGNATNVSKTYNCLGWALQEFKHDSQQMDLWELGAALDKRSAIFYFPSSESTLLVN
jgi:hypothetical protein